MRVHFPRRTYCSTRGAKTLYFAIDRGVGVIVNKAGSEVLEACRTSSRVSDLANKLAAGYESLAPIIEDAITPFLRALADKGFLTTGMKPPPKESIERRDIGRLHTVYLHVTDNCNLMCTYCYNERQRTENLDFRHCTKTKPLSPTELHLIIKDIAELGATSLILTGGEPLLRKDLCALADYAKRLGLKLTLLTNATLVTERRALEIAQSFDTVIASLDSFDARETEVLRPGASVEQVTAGIRRLSRAGVKHLIMRPVISKVNLGSFHTYAQKATNEIGCTSFSIAARLPNSPKEMDSHNMFPEPEQYSEALRNFYAELEATGGSTVKQELPLEGSGSCGAGFNILSIATNGDVFPCQSLHFDKYLIGNTRESSLAELFGRAQAKWRQPDKHFPRFEPCLGCELESICASKCHVYQHTFEGNKAIFYDRMCPFLKSELEFKLWREAARNSEVGSEKLPLSVPLSPN